MPERSADFPTPGAILDYWIGAATDDHLFADRQHKLWFAKSVATDTFITQQFAGVLTALHNGLADAWAKEGPRARLAAIIVLDQFSRNMFRGQSEAFASDVLALQLAKDGIARGDDTALNEVERSFFYMPFEHAESLPEQDEAVRLFEALAADARPTFKPLCERAADYAHQHRKVIREFGRFPHRNAILRRASTPEETAYLSKPGAGF